MTLPLSTFPMPDEESNLNALGDFVTASRRHQQLRVFEGRLQQTHNNCLNSVA